MARSKSSAFRNEKNPFVEKRFVNKQNCVLGLCSRSLALSTVYGAIDTVFEQLLRGGGGGGACVFRFCRCRLWSVEVVACVLKIRPAFADIYVLVP